MKPSFRLPELILVGVMILVITAAVVGGANIAGLLASTVAFVVWLPQARAVWAARNDPHALSSISVSTQVLLLSNAVLWGVYATQESAFWVAAPGLINAPLAVLSITLILRARQSQSIVVARCKHCAAGVWHKEFVTAPPGWGSVMECTGVPRAHSITVFDEQDIAGLRAQSA